MKTIRFYVIAMVVLAASGCASTYQIRVDSIAEAAQAQGTRYVLVSGMNDVTESDLYFKEFAAYFRPILAAKGYTEVESRADAQLEIALSYGSSSGRAEYYTYTRPIYHVTGGDQIRYREIRTDASGQKVETTGTFYVPIRTEVIGYTSELNSQTVYTNYAILDATTATTETDTVKKKPVWKTTIRLTDPSNDLRRLLPFMATASAPYVATNTGVAIKIEMSKDPARITVTPATPSSTTKSTAP